MDKKKRMKTHKTIDEIRKEEDTMAPAQVAEMISGWKNTIVSLGK